MGKASRERIVMNIEETMIAVDGRTGPIAAMTRTVGNMGASARRGICLLDARLRTLSAEPEEATTAEYAVVLVAATGFAAVLVALLKSDTIKTLLTNIVKKSLSVG